MARDDSRGLMLARKTGKGADVVVRSRSVESENRLRGETESVGDGDANAFVADVESEDARLLLHWHSLRRCLGQRQPKRTSLRGSYGDAVRCSQGRGVQ